MLPELNHLLVIEEAHRLLKNVEIERISEDMGNPKGKAVEHFTNMIAEMRSYGQGVIIAEQIPTKLAPDVIKNSSNKIIQRLVAADDQCAVANTIGMTEKESIYIGNLATGRALCHKEGMSLPVNVAISPIEEIFVSDGMLYGKNVVERLHRINVNIAKECVAEKIDLFALQLLNSILIQEYDVVKESIVILRKKCQTYLVKNNVDFILWGEQIAYVIASSDLVISPGSSMIVEALSVNTPCISYQFVDNHHPFCVQLEEMGIADFIGIFPNQSLDKRIKSLFSDELKFEKRENQSKIYSSLQVYSLILESKEIAFGISGT